METLIKEQLPLFETRGGKIRVNFDEHVVTLPSTDGEDSTFFKYNTAVFSVTAGLPERIEAIITACGTDDQATRDKADKLSRESLGQSLTEDYLKEMQRREYKRERDAALESMVYLFEDGQSIQIRPQDLANFQMAISTGIDRTWITIDNNVRWTTVSELQTAMTVGIQKGQEIWDRYSAQIESL
ncbi:hypothetical protein V6O07_23950, partial [Arthrospira platensis SPKY2]